MNDEITTAKEYNARTAVLVFELLRIFRDWPHYDHDEDTLCKVIKKGLKDIQNLDTAVVLRLYELIQTHLHVEKLLTHQTLEWSTISNLLQKKEDKK